MKTLCAALALLAALPGCTQSATTAPPAATPAPPRPPDEVRLAGNLSATAFASPAVFEAAFRPGTTIRQDSTLFRCRPQELGQLRSESGKLITGDPIAIADKPAFTQRFPIGAFPVQVALLAFGQDERVGFVRVVFDTARVVRWQPALLPGQAPLALRDSTFYCYGVDAGLGTIMDSVANQEFARLGQATWDRVFIDAADRPHYVGYLYQFGGHNLATFPTGLGDGCYPTYLGFDARGRVCRLLTDFSMINW